MRQHLTQIEGWYSKRLLRIWWSQRIFLYIKSVGAICVCITLAQFSLYFAYRWSFFAQIPKVSVMRVVQQRLTQLANEVKALQARVVTQMTVNESIKPTVSLHQLCAFLTAIPEGVVCTEVRLTPSELIASGKAESQKSIKAFMQAASIKGEGFFSPLLTYLNALQEGGYEWNIKICFS